MKMGFPLWQRGVRGDFIEIFDSIGVLTIIFDYPLYFELKDS
jgi:hypothetical protein